MKIVERGMPVWGRHVRHEAMGAPCPSGKPQAYVAAEIFAIIEHLRGMQQVTCDRLARADRAGPKSGSDPD